MRKSHLIIILTLIAHVGTIGQNNNFRDLFNGKNFDGWSVLNGSAEYKIENEIIKGISKTNTPNTFLATTEQYDDFILELEAKMEDGLNSGIQIRSHSLSDYLNGRVHGLQVELDASARSWSGGIYDEARRGWLYNLECNPEGKKAYKHNDWNKIRIEAIGNNIRVWFNDIPTADLIDEKVEKGFIALQVHSIGDDISKVGKSVEFRNIRILTENIRTSQSSIDNAIPQISYLKNELTKKEISDGWKLLWDGKSAVGWQGAKLDHFPQSGWKIDKGILSVDKSSGGESANGGDIVTVKEYGQFELEVDFKFTEGANSGIKYFVDRNLNKGEGSAIGCEYQILDDELHPDGKMGVKGNRTLASLYDLIPAESKFYSPNDNVAKRVNKYSWNRAKIISKGNKIEHYLNGIKVVEYVRGTQSWKALVAYSKYKDWPNFGELPEGHILLQDHGDEVFFKNIKIRELDNI